MELENKIIELSKKEYRTVKEQRIIDLLKTVLVDKETDISEIVKSTSTSVITIKKYLDEESSIKKFLTEGEFQFFKQKIEYIFGLIEQKNKKLELDLLEGIINDIFYTRHKISSICSDNYFNKNRFENIISNSNFIDEFFGAGTQQRVNEKIKINDSIRKKCPRNMVLVEDKWDVFIAKEDVFYLNELDHRKLVYASNYLCSGSDIEFVAEKFNTSVISVLGFLSDPKLEQILKPEWYEKLKYSLNIERLLMENKLAEKNQFLINFVDVLQKSNFDKKLCMSYFKLSLAHFDRILNEIIRMPFFNEETKKDIRELLNIKNTETKVR